MKEIINSTGSDYLFYDLLLKINFMIILIIVSTCGHRVLVWHVDVALYTLSSMIILVGPASVVFRGLSIHQCE